MTYGTEEQKQKYVPALAKGEKLGAFGLTEPGAGTDAQGQQTKAVLDGDEWVLNGSKCFITNGKEADVYIIIAVTGTIEKRGRKVKEISAFIVEKGTPGFTFGTKEKKMGIRGSSTYELIFTDCRIPKENLLGQQGKGFNIAMHTLDGGRIGNRRAGPGSGGRRSGDHHQICKREKTVRTFHRSVPEYSVPAG